MATNTTTTAMTILSAEKLFRIIKSFPRVWFSLNNSNPYVCYEVPVPSEDVSLDCENGEPTISAGTDVKTTPFVAISCAAYQCKVEFQDDDIIHLDAVPLTNGDSKGPGISICVTQYF